MPAEDTFSGYIGDRTGPPNHVFAVTPDDDAELEFVTRAIVLGEAGAVKVLTQGGEDHTYPFLAAGISLPMRVRKIFATGTTATGISGQY